METHFENTTLYPSEYPPSFSFNSATEEELFQYYRRSGFPNYERVNYSALYELRKVRQAGEHSFFNGEVFKKYSSANGFLFSYFPHWIDVSCGSSKSLRESWDDDSLLRELIHKTLVFCKKHNEKWSTNRLRQNAKVYCAKQSVSNFNPVCARILYDRLAPGGVVYDMSMGWGGRLLGFHASSARKYIGCEPSTKTIDGLQNLQRDLAMVTGKEAVLIKSGSETVDLRDYRGQVDLAFTSPPYFDTEKYSDEPTQSYIAYPTLDRWINEFLFETIRRAYDVLKDSAIMAINYSNDERVTNEIKRISSSLGFMEDGVYKYEISSVSGAGAKYEPIFVFRKGGAGNSRSLKEENLFSE